MLDFLWLSGRHDLCRPAYLIAEDEEITQKMQAIIEASGGQKDIEEAKIEAEGQALHEREEALIAEINRQKRKKGKLVDVLQYAASIGLRDLLSYQPSGFEADTAKPKPDTIEYIESAGIDPTEIKTKEQSEIVKHAIMDRRRKLLATPKQIRKLEQYGFCHVGQWGFDEANNMIGRISLNSWRVPNGINPKTHKPKGE